MLKAETGLEYNEGRILELTQRKWEFKACKQRKNMLRRSDFIFALTIGRKRRKSAGDELKASCHLEQMFAQRRLGRS